MTDDRTPRADETGGEAVSFDFEEAMAELDAIVARLESDEIDLDAAISLFRRGVERLESANRWLESARGRVEELILDRSGELTTRPLDGPPDDTAGSASGDADATEPDAEPESRSES